MKELTAQVQAGKERELSYQKQVERLEQQLKDAASASADGAQTQEQLRAQIQDLKNQIKDLQEQLARNGASSDQQTQALKSKIELLQQQVDQQKQTMELAEKDRAQKEA